MRNSLWRNKVIYIIIMLFAVSICVPNVLSVDMNKQPIVLDNNLDRGIIWVDDNNTEGPYWNGTEEFPYQTIQDAINNVTPVNNTINVVSGDYERFKCEKNDINILGQNYNLPDYDPASYPTIDGKDIGNVVTFVNCHGCKFDSFNVTNGEYTPGLAGVYIYYCYDINISNCKIENNYYGLKLEKTPKTEKNIIRLCSIGYNRIGIFSLFCDGTSQEASLLISQNHIYKNTKHGISINQGKHAQIYLNNIYNNSNRGVIFWNRPTIYSSHDVSWNNIYRNKDPCVDYFLTSSDWSNNYMPKGVLGNFPNNPEEDLVTGIIYGNIPPDSDDEPGDKSCFNFNLFPNLMTYMRLFFK